MDRETLARCLDRILLGLAIILAAEIAFGLAGGHL